MSSTTAKSAFLATISEAQPQETRISLDSEREFLSTSIALFRSRLKPRTTSKGHLARALLILQTDRFLLTAAICACCTVSGALRFTPHSADSARSLRCEAA